MIVEDLLNTYDLDVDVCDDYDERCYIAFCSGYNLTDAGRARFATALKIPVILWDDNSTACLRCDTAEEAQSCADLFYSIAGFCADSDFDSWFKEAY